MSPRAGAFLSGTAGANYDLLASSDVVPYVRRLDELFMVAAAAAAPEARFAFSVEKPLGGGEVEIGATGRFRHAATGTSVDEKKPMALVSWLSASRIALCSTCLDVQGQRNAWCPQQSESRPHCWFFKLTMWHRG